MSEYKYPYIPKEYYAAVMFACKMIRKNGYFNKAVKAAANYYDVDEREVAKYVRKRQGAGQKGTTRKYNYYAVWGYKDYQYLNCDVYAYDSWEYKDDDYIKHAFRKIIKATSADNAWRKVESENGLERFHTGYGDAETGEINVICHIEEYPTKEQAEQRAITKKEFLSWITT